MNIELYISKKQRIVLACDRKFEAPVDTVYLDPETRMMSLTLIGEAQRHELNCPIDDEILPYMHGKTFCALGFFNGGKLLEAQYVPFEINNHRGGV